MRPLWNRFRRKRDLEAELRGARPAPRREFLASLAARVREADRPARPRLALAGALTAVMLIGLASVGGLGYAGTAVVRAVDNVRSILVSSHEGPDTVVVRGLSAGGDQYQPGFAWGDPSHNHTGPPGLRPRGGEFAPPLRAVCTDGTARVTTRIVLDEQADLNVSVLGSDGKKLLLSQEGSRIGGPVSGKQTKTIRYRMLIPRVLRIVLRIPCSVLESGQTYRIRITATDPDGQTSSLGIPFRALVGTA